MSIKTYQLYKTIRDDEIELMMNYIKEAILSKVSYNKSYDKVWADCIDIKINGVGVEIDEYRKRANLEDWGK